MSEDDKALVERLLEPWERMGTISAPKINRILRERKEAADRITQLSADVERLKRSAMKGPTDASE